jgi:LPXTG-motif cell wall-anchored protein
VLLAVAVAGGGIVAAPVRAQDDGTDTENLAPLSPTPQDDGGSGNGSTTPTPRSSAGLPKTGSDARVLALTGLTLLLAGIGVRLRTIPERF